jgi:hypothetical protein
MGRLTITLSPERHRALKETAFRRGKTIRSLVEESLDAYGIKTASQAAALVARARERAGMSEKAAMDLAVAETRAHRSSRAARTKGSKPSSRRQG